MLVTGTLKCLHCGHQAGDWTGRAGSPLLAAGLRARPEGMDPLLVVRCLRCRGPVFLDEPSAIRTVSRLKRIARLRRQVAEMQAIRRSRQAA